MNRRGFLAAVGAGAATAALTGHARAKGKAPGAVDTPFFFIQMADPQLFWGSQESWATAIRHANRLKPAFVAVCGDLLNRNGNPANVDLAKDERRAKAYLEETAKLDKGIGLYNVAGNHDVCNTPTAESLQWYRKRFGKLWYSFTHGNCLFLVLESDVMKNPKGVPDTAGKQMKWLRGTLAAARGKSYRHKIVFMHHPMCLKAVDEKSVYFNMPLELRKELLDMFSAHGVRATFSGHYHRNVYVKAGDIELVTSASTGKALGKDPLGFRIVKVYSGRIEHTYYGYNDLPDRIDLTPAK